MTGIAGWAGSAGGAAPAERIVDVMLNAGHRHTGAVRRQAIGADAKTGGAVGVQGWPAVVDAAGDDGVIAAVHGHVRWRDPALRALAADSGSAAALILAWRTHGVRLFDVLGGPASLALVDSGKREALVAVDRAGIHQMCYAPTRDGGMAFAADSRAVCAHPLIEASISRQAIFNYLYFYVSPAPRTIFEGVRKLFAGQYAHLRNGEIAEAFYWQPPYEEPAGVDPAALAGEVIATLDAGVGRAVTDAGDAPVGAFLSGGLDSTTVSGLLARHRPGAKCFTIAFPEEKYNELPWAEAGARHFGVEHVTHVLTPADAADAIAGLVAAHDEPHGNSSSVPAFVCARVARDHGISHLLAGDGGDEIFAGNERYVEQRRYDAWHRLPAPLRRALVLPALRLAAPGGGDGTGAGFAARARAYAERAATPLPDRLQIYNLLETADLAALFDGDFLDGLDREEPRRLQRQSYARVPQASELKRMHQLDLQITLADNDLRKVNRACELAGVQVAYPMLDDDVVSMAARIPSALLLRDGRLRGFFKDAMASFLPETVLTKAKHGFGMPFSEWTRQPGALRDMAIAALDGFGRRGILRRDLVTEIRRALADGADSRFGGMVWDIMMLETWLARHETVASIR